MGGIKSLVYIESMSKQFNEPVYWLIIQLRLLP